MIFALLLLYRTTSHARGQCFALYVLLYSTARFFLEYLRGDYTEPVLGLLHSAQMTSVVCFALAASAFLYLEWRRRRPEVQRVQKRAQKGGPPS